jgi:hypothetical protein
MTRIRIASQTARRASIVALTLLLALSLPAVSAAAGAKDIVFKTGWKDRDITIDGRNDDWQGALGYLGDPVVALGFLNDVSGLYVCIATNVPDLRDGMIKRGLTVWIDPKGGKKKTLGIRLAPAAAPAGPGQGPKGTPPQGAQEPQPAEAPAPPQATEPGARIGASSRLMVRLPGREDWTAVDETGSGVVAALEESNGLAVFEMMIPLAAGPEAPVALGAAPGASIAVSFETPKPERPVGRGKPGDRPERINDRNPFDVVPRDRNMTPDEDRGGDRDPLKEAQSLKLRVEMKLARPPA